MKYLLRLLLKIVELFRRGEKKPVLGIGISHVFLLWFSRAGETTTIDDEMAKFFHAIDNASFKIQTTWLRLMMDHSFQWTDGKTYGQRFTPYNVHNDCNSGWNQLWFDKVEEFASKCAKRNITLGLSLIDANHIDEGPYPLTWYEDGIHEPMKQYWMKLLETLGYWKDGTYFPKYPFVMEPTNEQLGHTFRPTTKWMFNATRTLKVMTSCKIPVGCWWNRYPSNADFRVRHSGIGAGGNFVVNEEQVGNQWGGGAEQWQYEKFLREVIPNGTKVILAQWDDSVSSKPFAESQMNALAWAHEQGLF